MSIFEYDEEKELALFRAAEREEGREEGLAEGIKQGHEQGLEQGLCLGLRALINSLQEFCPDSDTLYSKVIANPDYADLTREEFETCL